MKPIALIFLFIHLFLVTPLTAAYEELKDSTKLPQWFIGLAPIHSHLLRIDSQVGSRPQTTLFYIEWGANLRGGVNLFKDSYRIGGEFKVFWTGGEGQIPGWYYLTGIYQQIDLLPKRRNRLYLEGGLLQSNMCMCRRGRYVIEPFHQKNIFYYGIGGGFDIYLNKYFDFNLGYMRYAIINRLPLKFPWTQFVFGATYYFQARNKPKPTKKEKFEEDLRKVKEKNKN